MSLKEIYTEDKARKTTARLRLWRGLLAFLIAALALGLYFFAKNVDPIEPGPRQWQATLFLVLGGWLVMTLAIHGLFPARRAKNHVMRMRASQEDVWDYRGPVIREEKPQAIGGSIKVYRIKLTDKQPAASALLWAEVARDFPQEGKLKIQVQQGYIAAWQEADDEKA